MSSQAIERPREAPKTTLAKTIAASSTQDLNHLKHALAEMDLALSGYEEAEAYYEGTKPEMFSHARIARALRNTKDKYKLNFAKTPVNIVADRLRISSVTINKRTDEDTDPSNNPDEDNPTPIKKPKNDLTRSFEKNVWRKCGLARLNRELHQKLSEFGDGYYFVWTETEDETDPETETTRSVSNNRPVIYYNSPKTTRAIYDPEAPDVVMFVIKRWKHWDGLHRVNLYYKDRTEHFTLKAGIKPSSKEAGDPKFWESMGAATPNPYKRIPIFHYRNAMPYGKPEHYDAYGPQDAINKISTTMVHGTEWSGFPQRYGLAKPNSAIDGGNTGDDWDDEAESTAPDDTNADEMKSGPGTILDLKGFDSVGTFEVGEPKTMLEPVEFYVRALAQTTTTPLRYFYPPGAHPPSGESYRAEDTPLINKVGQRQDDYTETHAEVYAFAMEIVTGTPADEFAVDVRWAPAASIDDALGWEVVKKKIEAGVPRRQALIEAGYTADQVDEWLRNNNDKAELQRDVEVFSLFAAAAKNLADTATVNGVNPEAVGIVLTHLLQNFAPDGKTLPKWEEPKPEPLPPNTPPPLIPTATGDPQANGQLPKSRPGDPTPTTTTPRPGARTTPPPRLDLPPGGIRPERSTTFGSR